MFLNEKEETKSNYVLVGYFYRILSHLITSQSSKIVQYFFEYPKKNELDILDLLVKNMNRKSMGEIINKLLLFNEENYGDFVQKKMELFVRILEELKATKEEQKYECICSTLEACFYNKGFVIEFMKDQKYIDLLYTILEESKDQSKKSISVMKLLIKINETILKNIEGRCTPVLEQENPMDIINMFSNNYTSADDITKDPDADLDQLTKNVIIYSCNSLEKNKFSFIEDLDSYSEKDNGEFNTTYQMPQKKLGMKKLAQIEIFRTILDILVNAYAKCNIEEQSKKVFEIIKEKKLFEKINKIFFDFPFCNLYQAIYIQIIDIVINELSPDLLIKALFDEKEGNNLIQVLIDKALNNMKFAFVSQRIAFHPNFSIECSLLSKIFLSTNKFLKDLIKDNKNLEVFYNVVGEEVSKVFEQKLLLTDNEVQINNQDDEKKTLTFFGKKNFMELLEEDLDIYKVYLNGEDYQKKLDEKKEKERIEKENMEKEQLEEEKKMEEENYFNDNDEEEEEKKKSNLKGSINLEQGDEEENNEKNNEENNEGEEKEKENEGEGEGKEEGQKEEEKGKEKPNEESVTTEGSEQDKIYNDSNYWKPEIKPNDDIINEIMNLD